MASILSNSFSCGFGGGGGGRHTFVTLFVVEGQTFVTNCDKAGGGQFYAEIV